ncbi:MAG: hypothetical protein PHX51_08500 [Clostridia bacterium]|nr:hypothetical protein [Clostridia bacterium]
MKYQRRIKHKLNLKKNHYHKKNDRWRGDIQRGGIVRAGIINQLKLYPIHFIGDIIFKPIDKNDKSPHMPLNFAVCPDVHVTLIEEIRALGKERISPNTKDSIDAIACALRLQEEK